MVRDPQNRLRFGAAEWIALLTVALMLLGMMGTSMGVLWSYSDRVLTLENHEVTNSKALDEIKANVQLIPRIDQRVMALEQASERHEERERRP